LNVLGVIFAWFSTQSQMRAGERGSQFGDQFLSSIGVIAESFAQLAIAANYSRRPVGVLMRELE
jgi:hypothetical protein